MQYAITPEYIYTSSRSAWSVSHSILGKHQGRLPAAVLPDGPFRSLHLGGSVDAAVCIRWANLLLSLRLTVGPYLFHLLMRPCDLALVKTGWDKNGTYYLQILALGGAIASLV